MARTAFSADSGPGTGTAASPDSRGDVAVGKNEAVLKFHRRPSAMADREHSVIRMPSYEAVADDLVIDQALVDHREDFPSAPSDVPTDKR